MFEINGTLVIFMASFLVFMVLLNQVFLKPVGEVLAKRAKKIQSDIEAAKAARTQAEEVLNQYQKHLESTRSQAQVLINNAIGQANNFRNHEVMNLKEEGRKKVEAAKAGIAAERSDLLHSLVKQENELVSTMMEKLLGEKVNINLDANKVLCVLEEAS